MISERIRWIVIYWGVSVLSRTFAAWESVRVEGAAFLACQEQMQGGAAQAMSMHIVEERNEADVPARPEPEGRMGVTWRSLRCSSSMMCNDIASSSRLALAM
jgi:hypothetical protein